MQKHKNKNTDLLDLKKRQQKKIKTKGGERNCALGALGNQPSEDVWDELEHRLCPGQT